MSGKQKLFSTGINHYFIRISIILMLVWKTMMVVNCILVTILILSKLTQMKRDLVMIV